MEPSSVHDRVREHCPRLCFRVGETSASETVHFKSVYDYVNAYYLRVRVRKDNRSEKVFDAVTAMYKSTYTSTVEPDHHVSIAVGCVMCMEEYNEFDPATNVTSPFKSMKADQGRTVYDDMPFESDDDDRSEYMYVDTPLLVNKYFYPYHAPGNVDLAVTFHWRSQVLEAVQENLLAIWVGAHEVCFLDKSVREEELWNSAALKVIADRSIPRVSASSGTVVVLSTSDEDTVPGVYDSDGKLVCNEIKFGYRASTSLTLYKYVVPDGVKSPLAASVPDAEFSIFK